MVPTQTLFRDMLDLLAADTAGLAVANPNENKVALFTNNASPSRARVLGDLTLAAWTGSTPKVVTAGAQAVGYDTIRNEWFIQLSSPVGGWYWRCTVAPGAPVLNYGVALVDTAVAVLLGMQLFATPVLVGAVDDTVDLVAIRFYESDLLTA